MRFSASVLVFGCFVGCSANSAEFDMMMQADEVAIHSGHGGGVVHVVTLPKEVDSIRDTIMNSRDEQPCRCAHGLNLIFKKAGRTLTEASYCGHCIILDNGSHLENHSLDGLVAGLLPGGKKK